MAQIIDTPESALETLRGEPDYRTFEFDGEEREVHFCMYAFEKARGMGHDPVTANSTFADYLYAGMLPFPSAMDHDTLSIKLTRKRMNRIRRDLKDVLPEWLTIGLDDEEATAGKEQGAGENP